MTMQIRDTLRIEGDTFFLEPGILEPFFRKNPEKKPRPNILMSSLHRRYVAHFELQNNELFIYKITIPKGKLEKGKERRIPNRKRRRVQGYDVVDLSKMFSDENGNKISFFNGFIVLCFYPNRQDWKAQLRSLPHQFFHTEEPEGFKVLCFKEGKLMETKAYDAKEIDTFKDRQFFEFKKSESYKAMLNERLDWYAKEENSKQTFNRERFDEIIYDNIFEYTKEFL